MIECHICTKGFDDHLLLKTHLTKHSKEQLISAFTRLHQENKYQPVESAAETITTPPITVDIKCTKTCETKSKIVKSKKIAKRTNTLKRKLPKPKPQQQDDPLQSFEGLIQYIKENTTKPSIATPQENTSTQAGGYACLTYPFPAELTYDHNRYDYYNQHVMNPTIKIYICHFCYNEYDTLDAIKEHISIHSNVQHSAASDDATNHEQQSSSDDKTRMNTMYNFYSAGFNYAKKHLCDMNFVTEFYNVYLQYSNIMQEGFFEHYGYLCNECGFKFFDSSIRDDHISMIHQQNACNNII